MIEVQYDDGVSMNIWYDELQDIIFAEYEDAHGNRGARFEFSAIKTSKTIYDATGIIFNIGQIKKQMLGRDRHVIVNSTGLHVNRTNRPIRLTDWRSHA